MQQTRISKISKPLAVGVVVLAAIIAAISIMQARQFHVVRTNPAFGNFPSSASYIKFYFNEPLASSGVSVASTPAILGETSVSGKILTIPIVNALNLNQSYTITIKSIGTQTGKKLTNKTFRFTPKNISFQNLPKEMQQAILKAQANKPLTSNSYTYIGDDDLINNGGLSQDQLDDLEQALFQYFQVNKIKPTNVTFTSIVSPAPHPDDPLAPNVTTFNVSFMGQTYHAKLATTDISTARLYLSNSAGQQVYDSQYINPSQTVNQ